MIINPFIPIGYPISELREVDRVAEELEMRRAWLAAYGDIPIGKPKHAVTRKFEVTQD